MKIYKVIFAKNAVVSCQIVTSIINLDPDYSYEHANGKLIYAMIKASDEVDAISKSNKIIEEFNRNSAE